jgi:uncharacterized membrane protein YeaQ/YmgE (transglycosylase-associated protein family)
MARTGLLACPQAAYQHFVYSTFIHFFLGGAMGILSWIIFGLIAGALAKWIMPGKDPGGWIVTILIGIAGGVLGGYLGTFLGLGDVSGFNLKSFGLAIVGSLVLLGGYRLVKGNS